MPRPGDFTPEMEAMMREHLVAGGISNDVDMEIGFSMAWTARSLLALGLDMSSIQRTLQECRTTFDLAFDPWVIAEQIVLGYEDFLARLRTQISEN